MYCDACSLNGENFSDGVPKEAVHLINLYLYDAISDDETCELGQILSSSAATRAYFSKHLAVDGLLYLTFIPDGTIT